MFTRTAFALVVALASVSGALAAPRTQANDTQTAVGVDIGDSGPVWGFKLTQPQENNAQAVRKSYGAYTGTQSEPRSERSESGPVWGFPLQQPTNHR